MSFRSAIKRIYKPQDRIFLGTEGVSKQQQFFKLSASERKSFVPEQGGSIESTIDSTVEIFLQKIGRDCAKFAEKFPDWNTLFTASSLWMDRQGIPAAKRKYIITSRDWFKRGKPTEAVEIPARKKKYLQFIDHLELEKKLKQGGDG